MQEIKKIVAIGPESTGKSTLCSLLAKHFNTQWCPEYAREYLLAHGTDYTFETLATIAKGQLALEDKFMYDVRCTMLDVEGNPAHNTHTLSDDNAHRTSYIIHRTLNGITPLFFDTDMYVMKVWCEYVFGRCHQFILDEIVSRKYDLYLLCNTDLPWVKDELREYPDEKIRVELFHIYKDILINQNVPWVEVKGNAEDRLQTAIEAVNRCCIS